nr:type II toxin-antitoxin system RelE/ParE family toxin [Parabacteroides goldsteinii]
MDIYFTPLAQQRLDDIVEYLDITWGDTIKDKFLSEITRCLKLISITPDLFPLFEDYLDVRQCLVTCYNTLFYRVTGSQIQVLTIWDNRMNPQTLKFILSGFD